MATKFITVSIDIMHDKNLSPNQKFILAEIEQLSSLEKGCIASNRHFSELIGISVAGVSNAINDLVKKGYIHVDNSQTKRNHGRIITIHSDVDPLHSDVIGIHSDVETKENKTINKTKNTYDEFISYLKSKSKYKTKVSKTKEGEKLFKQIEDKKKLIIDYLKHQEEKKDYAVRITAFMEDYETVYKQQEKKEGKFGGWSE